MSELKPNMPEIELGDKKYKLLFDLNAIDEIQDKFDIPISMLTDLMQDERKAFKVLKTLLTVLINEAIDDAETGEPHVDERFVGRKITIADIPRLNAKVISSLTNNLPEGDGEDPTQSA